MRFFNNQLIDATKPAKTATAKAAVTQTGCVDIKFCWITGSAANSSALIMTC